MLKLSPARERKSYKGEEWAKCEERIRHRDKAFINFISVVGFWQKQAYLHGGKNGGEYLESIKKYNLAELTKEEWLTFCECICKNYHAQFNARMALDDDEIPF